MLVTMTTQMPYNSKRLSPLRVRIFDLLLGLVCAAFVLPGCYAEIGVGYVPVAEQTTSNPDGFSDKPITTLTTRFGFYLDVPLGPTGVGVGVGPSGGGATGVYASEGDADVSLSSAVLRGDVVLPVKLFSSARWIQTRLTGTYSTLLENRVRYAGSDEFVTGESSGTAYFLGASLGTRDWYGTVLGSIGYQSIDQEIRALADADGQIVRTRGHGVAIKIMYAWLPAYRFLNTFTHSKPTGRAGSCPGGHYTDNCDVDGNCRSKWECP